MKGSTPMTQARPTNPWPGLWALIIGFFMLLVDTTIVSVANPAIKAALDPQGTMNPGRVLSKTPPVPAAPAR